VETLEKLVTFLLLLLGNDRGEEQPLLLCDLKFYFWGDTWQDVRRRQTGKRNKFTKE
jgi:hypothetical protein